MIYCYFGFYRDGTGFIEDWVQGPSDSCSFGYDRFDVGIEVQSFVKKYAEVFGRIRPLYEMIIDMKLGRIVSTAIEEYGYSFLGI